MMKKQREILEKKATLIKIAIDMHLRSYRVVRQIDYSTPQPAQKFAPQAFYHWLEKQRHLAERVVVCYEAGCFGYEPARRMQAMGAEVEVIAPQDWEEQGKRQVNDKHDAQVMCRRLSEYLAGHRKALSVVRIPSPEEEARRAQGRMREQFRRQSCRMAAMGRSLLLQREMAVSGRWWKGTTWVRIIEGMPSWVVAQLETWKKLIELTEKEALQNESQLKAAAPRELIFGEGELTHELLARELLDARRGQKVLGPVEAVVSTACLFHRPLAQGPLHPAKDILHSAPFAYSEKLASFVAAFTIEANVGLYGYKRSSRRHRDGRVDRRRPGGWSALVLRSRGAEARLRELDYRLH